jgi:hypothetical protein
MVRRDEVEFFLRLRGLWEGTIALPPPPRAPYDIETMKPFDVSSQWGWSGEIEPPSEDWWPREEAAWEAPELPLDDGQVLVLDAEDPFPADEWPD